MNVREGRPCGNPPRAAGDPPAFQDLADYRLWRFLLGWWSGFVFGWLLNLYCGVGTRRIAGE